MQNVLNELCNSGAVVTVENFIQEMEFLRICKELGCALDGEMEADEETEKNIPFPVFYGFDQILGMPYIGCSDFIEDLQPSECSLDYYQFRKACGV